MKKVSAIITTKNSADTLEALLKSLVEQSYQALEIVVVDNGSSDKTKEIAKKYTKLVFDKGPERSVQRNFGVEKSTGHYLVFLDSDMTLTPTVIQECVEVHSSNPKLGSIIIPEKSFGSNYWAKVKAFERKLNEGEAYFEAARFFPVTIFKEFNGYRTDITGPEDWDLPRRISRKYKTGRIKSYILHNEGSPTPLKLAKRKYYYGLTAHTYLANNNMPALNVQTLYFLRPGFYKNWKMLLRNPLLTVALIIMLSFETVGGGIGYLRGRFNI